MTDPAIVAKYIVWVARQHRVPLSHMHLHRLLYCTWIEYYRTYKRYLFCVPFDAWQFGPCMPVVHCEYCLYGGLPILHMDESVFDDHKLRSIVDRLVMTDDDDLRTRILAPDKPWSRVYVPGGGLDQFIPFSLIIDLECS